MHHQTAPITANRSRTSWNDCGTSASEPSIGDWLEDTRENSMKLLDSAIDFFVPKFTSATRMLKEQLSAEGVSVRVSTGCLAEFARIASAAAARTRQADEPYGACLRREIVTPCRFIREWTSSDKTFDRTEWGEFVSIARKYALPRPWRVSEAVASVRGYAVEIPAQGVLKTVR